MRLVMMGTGTFAEPTFETILREWPLDVVGLVTQPDRTVGRKSSSSRQTGRGLAAIAAAAGVPVVQPESINAPDGLAALRALKPDLLVVAAYGQILSNDVINAGPLGAINVHASLLPRHRGAAPVAHAILAGDAETGVTIIRISTGLDAGDMLAVEATPIGPDETAGELEARLSLSGAKLAVNVIRRMHAGPVTGAKQDSTKVTKAPKLKKEMGLVDWSRPAATLARHVRAMRPFPQAYSFLHRSGKPPQRIAIARAASSDSPVSLPPGMRLPDRPLAVATGAGVLEILELQPAGKQPMPADAFARGCPALPGDRFGAES
jgi:methionyl-tRNA formyltransferase